MDRFFPLSESAATPPTDVRAETTGQATSSDSEQGYGVTQQVEVVLVKHLALRAGAELRNGSHGFTPIAQGKYQFLRQSEHGLNASGGLRYKQVGFQSDGGEVESFFAVGRRFGKLLATGNLVAGRELSHGGMDIEGHAGVGYLLTERLMVGANARIQQEVEDEEGELGHTGREFELLSGGVVGYTWDVVDLSLMGGWYMPRASNSSGPLAMLRLGVNF
ncbi:MAG: hypothetical protein ACJ8AT_01190 [Hyalangium sp.]